MIGVYALCGSRPDTVTFWSALIPACCTVSTSTVPPRLASLVSFDTTIAPCRPFCFLSRYFESYWLPWYDCGFWSAVLQSSAGGLTGNATGEHDCGTPVVTLARSGRPVAAPAWSLQWTSSSTLLRNSTKFPTIA